MADAHIGNARNVSRRLTKAPERTLLIKAIMPALGVTMAACGALSPSKRPRSQRLDGDDAPAAGATCTAQRLMDHVILARSTDGAFQAIARVATIQARPPVTSETRNPRPFIWGTRLPNSCSDTGTQTTMCGVVVMNRLHDGPLPGVGRPTILMCPQTTKWRQRPVLLTPPYESQWPLDQRDCDDTNAQKRDALRRRAARRQKAEASENE